MARPEDKTGFFFEFDSREQHAEFKKYCKKESRTMQAQLRYMVRGLLSDQPGKEKVVVSKK